jgi:hypothetical protein
MQRYEKMEKVSEAIFKRTVGISKADFEELALKMEEEILLERENDPMKKRGISGQLSMKDKLLLTLYYLRQYPTFSVLGQSFGICESYASKIYHVFSRRLVKLLHVPGPKSLGRTDLQKVLIDATEQPIERPVKGQKAYYSGKKTSYR